MIAVGLELEMQARVSEQVGGALLDDSLALTVASALRSTLQSVRIADEVDATMRELIEARGLGGDEVRDSAPPGRLDTASLLGADAASVVPDASPASIVDAADVSWTPPSLAYLDRVWPGADQLPQQLSLDSEPEQPPEDRTNEWATPDELPEGPNEVWE